MMPRLNVDESKMDREKYDYRLVKESRVASFSDWEETDQKTDGQVLMRRKKASGSSKPQNATEETVRVEAKRADDAKKGAK